MPYRETLLNWIDELELSSYRDKILNLELPSLQLTKLANVTDLQDIPVGVSKLGGLPDLPPDITWPEYKDHALDFVAQINLNEIARFEDVLDVPLPATGLLSFFFDASQWGEVDAFYPGRWRVFYISDTRQLVRQRRPVNLRNRLYNTVPVNFVLEMTYPSKWSMNADRFPDLNLDEATEEGSKLLELFDRLASHKLTGHRMFGYPDTLQFDTYDPFFNNYTNHPSPDQLNIGEVKDEIAQRRIRPDWLLLLQVVSDADAEMMWGDVGHLFFYISRDDLTQLRLDKTDCTLEF